MKPCPAYAGFVPRSPIQEPFKKRATDPRKLSIMKSSYRSVGLTEIKGRGIKPYLSHVKIYIKANDFKFN